MHDTTQFSRLDWEAYATCYDLLCQLTPYRLLLQAVTERTITGARSILDLGCGTGSLLASLQKRTAAQLTGIDGSATMLAIARTKLQGTGVTLRAGDLEAAEAFDGQYDRITSTNVLYTLNEPHRFLKRVAGLLTPTGHCVITTPKAGFDNGLILKAHCNDQRPNVFWQQPHASAKREQYLIEQAFDDPALQAAMLFIARHNRRIAATTCFHFYSHDGILELFAQAGLTVAECSSCYADQAWLITAHT